MKKYTLFLFVTFITLCSCTSKDSYILKFEEFVTDVELNYKSYSEADWKLKDEEFKKLSEIQFEEQKNKMTPEEISKVNQLIGKYNGLKIASGINEIKDKIKDGIDQAKGLLKEIIPDSKK